MFKGERFGTISVEWDLSRAYQEVGQHTYVMILAVGGACVLLGLLIYVLVDTVAVIPINRISNRVLEFRRGIFNKVRPLPRFASLELRRL
nr:hypothetical protein [Desulfuromonadales bacterium]